jgi:hypothetical protein
MRPLVFALLLAGCASARLVGNVYRDGPLAFRVGALPPEWREVRAAEGPLAFHHRAGGSISAHAACESADDVPLDVLTNHLLIGFQPRHEIARRPVTLDGRAALDTRVDAALDGVPVALDLVVIKKDDCVYDFALVASREAFAARRPDFDRFVAGFAVEGR